MPLDCPMNVKDNCPCCAIKWACEC